MTKRIISLLLLVAVLFTMLPTAVATESEEALAIKLLSNNISNAKSDKKSITEAFTAATTRQTRAPEHGLIIPYVNMYGQSVVAGEKMYLNFGVFNFGYRVYWDEYVILIFKGTEISEDNLVKYARNSISSNGNPYFDEKLTVYTTDWAVGDYMVYCYSMCDDEIVSDIYAMPISIVSTPIPLKSVYFTDANTGKPVYSVALSPGEIIQCYVNFEPYNATAADRQCYLTNKDSAGFTVDTYAGISTIQAVACADQTISTSLLGKTGKLRVSTHNDTDGDNICNSCGGIAFKDILRSAWYYDAVVYAVMNGLFNGVAPNTFEPDSSMTRAMVVTVLWRYAGTPAVESSSFSDVPVGSWYEQAVSWAAANEIVNGVGDNRFDPDGLVTREQLAAIIYRYCAKNEIDISASADLATYPDAAMVSEWACDSMSWAVALGLINGIDQDGTLYLKPEGNATRAQVATILMRFIEMVSSVPDEPVEPPVEENI